MESRPRPRHTRQRVSAGISRPPIAVVLRCIASLRCIAFHCTAPRTPTPQRNATETKPARIPQDHWPDAARWLRSAAVQTEKGVAWPAVPGDAKTVSTGLYHGVAGVVLFFLEAYRSTNDESFLRDARAGADYLLRSIDGERQDGLYVGLAGVGFTLQETFKATDQAPYRGGAKRCVELLRQRAKRVGKGVEWGPVTDII